MILKTPLRVKVFPFLSPTFFSEALLLQKNLMSQLFFAAAVLKRVEINNETSLSVVNRKFSF